MRGCRAAALIGGLMLTAAVAPGAVHGDSDALGDHFVIRENKHDAAFSATITTNDRGVWIEVHGERSSSGQPGPAAEAQPVAPGPSAQAAPAPRAAEPAPNTPASTTSWYDPIRGYFSQTSDGHVNSLEGINIGHDAVQPGGWINVGEQEHPNTVPMAFSVDGQLQTIVWVPNQAGPDNVQWGAPPIPPPDTVITGGGGTDPHGVALDVLGHIPLPNIRIRVNPDIGLVAMPDWFWIDGYDGAPIQQSRTVTIPPAAPGLPPTSFTVTVRIWPDEYDWMFGDGGSLVAHTVGRAYPTQSDLQHTYEYSSLPFGSGFPVSVTVRFGAQYSVNGGAPQPLPTIQHTYEANHRVQEIQAIVNGHQP